MVKNLIVEVSRLADNREYTVQDLQDNLDYLNNTKNLIKNAIINKGQTITNADTFRSYADKIETIITVENLTSELNAQDLLISNIKNSLDKFSIAKTYYDIYYN